MPKIAKEKKLSKQNDAAGAGTVPMQVEDPLTFCEAVDPLATKVADINLYGANYNAAASIPTLSIADKITVSNNAACSLLPLVETIQNIIIMPGCSFKFKNIYGELITYAAPAD